MIEIVPGGGAEIHLGPCAVDEALREAEDA
jgi:hypothetical protein